MEGTNHSDAKSRVALHLFESQSAPPSSDLLGNVGGWQRSLESGVTATEVDEDGRVIVPEDGLYLLYAQECISCPARSAMEVGTEETSCSRGREIVFSIQIISIESR